MKAVRVFLMFLSVAVSLQVMPSDAAAQTHTRMPSANHFASQSDHVFFTDASLETQLGEECWESGGTFSTEMFHWAYLTTRFCILYLDVNHSEITESRDDEMWLQVFFSLEPVDLNALRSGSKKIKDFKWVLGGGAYVTSNSTVHDLYFPTGASSAESPSNVRSYIGSLSPKELMEQYLTPKSYVNSLAGRLAKGLCTILNDPENAILNGTDAWGSVNQRYYQDEEITTYGYEYIGGYSFHISTFMHYPKVTRQAFRSSGISYDNIPLTEYFLNNYPVDVRMVPQLPDADALPYRLSTGQKQQLSYVASCRGSSYLQHLFNTRWESSRPEIVSVNGNGMLTAHSPGEAVITLLIDDDNLSQGTNGTHRITGHVMVPLSGAGYHIEPQLPPGASTYLKKGTSMLFSVSISSPLTWNHIEVSFNAPTGWMTSDYGVISIGNNYQNPALFNAVGAGTATITATVTHAFSAFVFHELHPTIPVTDEVENYYGFGPVILTRDVEVTAVASTRSQLLPPLPEGKPDHTLLPGDSLLFTFLVWNQEEQAVISWKSSRPEVASVRNGMVKAHSPGEAIVHVGTYVNEWIPVGFERKITVPLPDSYQLSDCILSQGQTTQLTVPSLTWNNSDLPFTHSTWTSSNPAIVTITPDGQATAVNAGEATLSFAFSVAHSFNPITFTQRVIVPPFLRITPSLPLKKNTTTLTVGKPLQCYVEALYNFAPYLFSNYSWTSSNPAVATVTSGTGRVEALSPGETLLSVTIPEHAFGDSPLIATRRLTVIAKPAVHIFSPLSNESEGDITLPLYQSLQLTVKSYWNSLNYALSAPQWTSSHPDIVAVDPNGLITSLHPGTATITFTATGTVNPVTVTRRIIVSPR